MRESGPDNTKAFWPLSYSDFQSTNFKTKYTLTCQFIHSFSVTVNGKQDARVISHIFLKDRRSCLTFEHARRARKSHLSIFSLPRNNGRETIAWWVSWFEPSFRFPSNNSPVNYALCDVARMLKTKLHSVVRSHSFRNNARSHYHFAN